MFLAVEQVSAIIEVGEDRAHSGTESVWNGEPGEKVERSRDEARKVDWRQHPGPLDLAKRL
jgi:hypothetical protein